MVSFLNLIFPKNKIKIFIEDIPDTYDNHRVLFDYILNHDTEKRYKIIYFTLKPEKYTDLYGFQVKIVSSTLKGIYHKVTSKYVFYGYGKNRFDCFAVKNQIIFNLWHGSPLKKIGEMVTKSLYVESKCFTFFLTPSDFFIPMYKEAFHCKDSQFYLGGNPRNDLLNQSGSCFEKMGIEREKYSRLIAFLPTFRNSVKLHTMGFDHSFPLLNAENILELDYFLSINQIFLIIKLHHAHDNIKLADKSYSNILFLTNDDLYRYKVQLYQFLGQTDALITDYSSVYFDYLLTQKPIGFVLDDYEEYKSKRGFTVDDPLELMPGHKIYDYSDFIKFLEDLSSGRDPYIEDRKKMNALVNQYNSKDNCLSILNFLGLEF